MTEQENEKNEPTEPATPPNAETPGVKTEQEASLDEQVERLKDLLLRKAAEFENYKRRMETDMGNIVRIANEGLILSFLPVVDDLERTLKAARSTNDGEALSKGVELIHQKLLKLLESRGVTPLVTEGKVFDVHFHDALMMVPKEDLPHHTILQEVERGYMMNDKVLRHAKVVVSTSTGREEATSEPLDDSKQADTGAAS